MRSVVSVHEAERGVENNDAWLRALVKYHASGARSGGASGAGSKREARP